jgi:hypothetical protein
MRGRRQYVAESDAGTSTDADADPYPDSNPDSDAHSDTHADTDTHTDAGRHSVHDYVQRRVAEIADGITRFARDIHQQRHPRA